METHHILQVSIIIKIIMLDLIYGTNHLCKYLRTEYLYLVYLTLCQNTIKHSIIAHFQKGISFYRCS